MKARYNEHNKLLGIDYKGKRVIVGGKKVNEFEYGTDKTATNAIREFKEKLQEAQAEYKETGCGMFESEAPSEIGSTIRFNKETEGVSFENPQELYEMEVIDEETQKAKFELIKEVEDDMEINRKHILETFEGKFSREEVPDFELIISEMLGTYLTLYQIWIGIKIGRNFGGIMMLKIRFMTS